MPTVESRVRVVAIAIARVYWRKQNVSVRIDPRIDERRCSEYAEDWWHLFIKEAQAALKVDAAWRKKYVARTQLAPRFSSDAAIDPGIDAHKKSEEDIDG